MTVSLNSEHLQEEIVCHNIFTESAEYCTDTFSSTAPSKYQDSHAGKSLSGKIFIGEL